MKPRLHERVTAGKFLPPVSQWTEQEETAVPRWQTFQITHPVLGPVHYQVLTKDRSANEASYLICYLHTTTGKSNGRDKLRFLGQKASDAELLWLQAGDLVRLTPATGKLQRQSSSRHNTFDPVVLRRHTTSWQLQAYVAVLDNLKTKGYTGKAALVAGGDQVSLGAALLDIEIPLQQAVFIVGDEAELLYDMIAQQRLQAELNIIQSADCQAALKEFYMWLKKVLTPEQQNTKDVAQMDKDRPFAGRVSLPLHQILCANIPVQFMAAGSPASAIMAVADFLHLESIRMGLEHLEVKSYLHSNFSLQHPAMAMHYDALLWLQMKRLLTDKTKEHLPISKSFRRA